MAIERFQNKPKVSIEQNLLNLLNRKYIEAKNKFVFHQYLLNINLLEL